MKYMSALTRHFQAQIEKAAHQDRGVLLVDTSVEKAAETISPVFGQAVNAQIGRVGVGGLGDHRPAGSAAGDAAAVEAAESDAAEEKADAEEVQATPVPDAAQLKRMIDSFSRRAQRLLDAATDGNVLPK